MVIFRALRATLVHFADFVTGHGTSCAPCAVRHTPGALCTFIRAYSNNILCKTYLLDLAIHPHTAKKNAIEADMEILLQTIRIHIGEPTI